ncbi:Attractin-like protein 1 [Takifugu flavidus]|uniref:Attractin-like protein 1 n=1 Tax=Takifugu flavidus TaxID=433684 RepID=A0A5C6PG22_9TELE|nr:Attractin-like protein 1 [Takifugu flavidus]
MAAPRRSRYGSNSLSSWSHCQGIAIASALVDISQQRAMDFKERGLNLKHRKHTVHHQGTCV